MLDFLTPRHFYCGETNIVFGTAFYSQFEKCNYGCVEYNGNNAVSNLEAGNWNDPPISFMTPHALPVVYSTRESYMKLFLAYMCFQIADVQALQIFEYTFFQSEHF